MLIIGESINGSVPSVGKAIQNRDASFLARLAREQIEAGAEMLDVNACMAGSDEVEVLPWLVRVVQDAIDTPLMIDSTNAQAIEAALSVYQGHAVINSLSGEPGRWEQPFSLVMRYHCGVVILCIGGAGIPTTALERLKLAEELVRRALDAGMVPGDLYVDPLVMSLGADWRAGSVTLETIRLIHHSLPEIHTICAISNISYGLPGRGLLNASFAAMAMAMGLDTLLVNVRDKRLMATLRAATAIVGNDEYCTAYLKAYRSGLL